MSMGAWDYRPSTVQLFRCVRAYGPGYTGFDSGLLFLRIGLIPPSHTLPYLGQARILAITPYFSDNALVAVTLVPINRYCLAKA
jgi:hypothetical protein